MALTGPTITPHFVGVLAIYIQITLYTYYNIIPGSRRLSLPAPRRRGTSSYYNHIIIIIIIVIVLLLFRTI